MDGPRTGWIRERWSSTGHPSSQILTGQISWTRDTTSEWMFFFPSESKISPHDLDQRAVDWSDFNLSSTELDLIRIGVSQTKSIQTTESADLILFQTCRSLDLTRDGSLIVCISCLCSGRFTLLFIESSIFDNGAVRTSLIDNCSLIRLQTSPRRYQICYHSRATDT